MKNIKSSDILKKVVRTFCTTILCGIALLAFMLLLVKHNEVCELIFSGAGFAVGALVAGLVVGFLVGYFKSFFKATKVIDDLIASREHLKSRLQETKAQLIAYEQLIRTHSKQENLRNKISLIQEIEDFPIDADPVAPTEESAD